SLAPRRFPRPARGPRTRRAAPATLSLPSSPAQSSMAFCCARGYTPPTKRHKELGEFSFMAEGLKRVFSVNRPPHPLFTEILTERAELKFDLRRNDSADDVAAPVLAGAHAYQSGSARDELAKKYHAGPDLLRRTQSLLIVSTNGAGYDTVNLKACTEAGIL